MPTLSKSALIDQIASSTGSTKKAAAENLSAVFDTIFTAVKQGNTVSLAGIGTFKLKKSEARTGRNPRTGEPIAIEAKTSVTFKAAPSVTTNA